MRYRSSHPSRACPASSSPPGSPATASASGPAPASWRPIWLPATRLWSTRRRFACPGSATARTRGRTRSRADLVARSLVNRGEFLDAQPIADARDQLFRVIDYPDRVLVGGRAPPHVGLPVGRGREIVDQ